MLRGLLLLGGLLYCLLRLDDYDHALPLCVTRAFFT